MRTDDALNELGATPAEMSEANQRLAAERQDCPPNDRGMPGCRKAIEGPAEMSEANRRLARLEFSIAVYDRLGVELVAQLKMLKMRVDALEEQLASKANP